MKLEKLLRLALRASTLLLLGSGGGAGAAEEEDVEFSPPPMPPQPPVDCRELQDFSEIKNQEPVSFCYQQEIIGAVTEGDAFLFRPEAPADMEHMIAAAREFMPWFTCQAEMRSRDEACGVIYSAMQKQGLVILRETIRASVFEIPPRTRYAAPAGKQVTLTVNGVETRPEPGVYRGSVIFTVADAFDIVHGRSHYPARAAVCIVNGYRPEYSVPAAVISGTVTDETAKDIVIDSRNDNFNPILVGGSGSYSIQSPKITMVGHGGDDFAGYGAGIMVTGSANVTVDNADIETTGSVRTAVWAGDHAALLVKNSRIAGHEGDTTDFKVGVMNTVPWPLGLSGNLRTTNLLDYANVTYLNCHISSEKWGVLSTDGTWKGSGLQVINSVARVTGNSGYGTYSDMCAINHYYGAEFHVPSYGLIVGGGGKCGAVFGCTTRENVPEYYDEIPPERRDAPCKIFSAHVGVLWHSNLGGTVSLEPGTEFSCGHQVFLMKGAKGHPVRPILKVNGAKLHSECGILFQLMESDDANHISGRQGMAEFYEVPRVCPVLEEGFDPTDPGAKGTIPLFFSNMELAGDIYNTRWTSGQNVSLTLENVRLSGVISSGIQSHRHLQPGARITKETAHEIGNVTAVAAPTQSNGMLVTLDGQSCWTVTGTSFLSRITLRDPAQLAGRLFVDGQEIFAPRGTYAGHLTVEPL